MINHIAIVAGSSVSHRSMGGGDRIFCELGKYWQEQGIKVTLIGPSEAYSVAKIGGLETTFVETSNLPTESLGTVKTYLLRIWKSLRQRQKFGEYDLIYSASESLPDVILSLMVKRQNPKVPWVIGFYLKARNPFLGEVSLRFSSLNQFFQQQVSLVLMKLFGASAFWVAGRPDELYLTRLGFRNVLKIGGGVDLDFVSKVPDQEKIYDGCFVGRLSSQKGIDDLLEIWEMLVSQKPGAKLSVNGWGHPGEVERFLKKVEEKKLKSNLDFFNFLDAFERFRVIKQSKVSLFPSYYESFGLVILESLAAGVPVVAYDLDVLRDNFIAGVVYVPRADKEKMAKEVLKILSDESLCSALLQEGRRFSQNFGWEKVGQITFGYLSTLTS